MFFHSILMMMMCVIIVSSSTDFKLHFGGGFGPAEWDYSLHSTSSSNGLFGWSYYLRAFNLIREETPTQEIGWGQWSKPASPAVGKPLEVCGMHPAGFVCDEPPEPSELENYESTCYAAKCTVRSHHSISNIYVVIIFLHGINYIYSRQTMIRVLVCTRVERLTI